MRNLANIVERAFGYRRTITPNLKKGDKLRLLTAIRTDALTCWNAPYTGSCAVTIPEGTVVKVIDNSVRSAAGFSCVPVDYDAFGFLNIPEHADAAKYESSYAGYYLVLLKSQIGWALEKSADAD
jgi:hypothetical protein